MNSNLEGFTPIQKQAGAALVVALVLLAAITVIGISNMQSSTLEMKMINAQKQRNENFAIAEAGLIQVESALVNDLDLVRDDLFTDRCSTGSCFTDPCTGGLCFDGSYTNAGALDELDCEIAPNATAVARENYWADETTWTTAGRHGAVPVIDGLPDVKYTIEFLCFVGENIYSDPSTGDPLFRITVLYEPNTFEQPIMLQSMYSFEISR